MSRVCFESQVKLPSRGRGFHRAADPLTQPRRLARTGRAAEPLARSGRRARGTRVVARRARAVMGKGLDLDAWIAKVRARAGAAPPRRSPRVDAKRLARCARLSPRRVADLRRSRRGTASAPPHSRPRGRASAARVSASSPFSRFLGRRASLTSARPDRASFVAALRRKNQKTKPTFRRSSDASLWRRESSSLFAGTSRRFSWRRATSSRCVRP